VSLAPSITETLYFIGAGSNLVGVSDYCDFPAEARRLPRVGSGITPHYEPIARLAPTLILTERNTTSHMRELSEIAPTEALPWLTLEQITESVARLGELTGQRDRARVLMDELRKRLRVNAPSGAPRVLLTFGNESGKLDAIWFVRDDSVHGAVLRAAGGRNAVEQRVAGAARLSIQKVLELDPDMVILLEAQSAHPKEEAMLEPWRSLTVLRAVRERRLAALITLDPFTTGPRILELVLALRAQIERLKAAH
jgi:iron complex transport system substrate-binding protein